MSTLVGIGRATAQVQHPHTVGKCHNFGCSRHNDASVTPGLSALGFGLGLQDPYCRV